MGELDEGRDGPGATQRGYSGAEGAAVGAVAVILPTHGLPPPARYKGDTRGLMAGRKEAVYSALSANKTHPISLIKVEKTMASGSQALASAASAASYNVMLQVRSR
jgi:hypothetical protein